MTRSERRATAALKRAELVARLAACVVSAVVENRKKEDTRSSESVAVRADYICKFCTEEHAAHKEHTPMIRKYAPPAVYLGKGDTILAAEAAEKWLATALRTSPQEADMVREAFSQYTALMAVTNKKARVLPAAESVQEAAQEVSDVLRQEISEISGRRVAIEDLWAMSPALAVVI